MSSSDKFFTLPWSSKLSAKIVIAGSVRLTYNLMKFQFFSNRHAHHSIAFWKLNLFCVRPDPLDCLVASCVRNSTVGDWWNGHHVTAVIRCRWGWLLTATWFLEHAGPTGRTYDNKSPRWDFVIKVRFQQNLVFTQKVLSLICLVDRRLIRPMFELQIGGRHWILGRPVGGFAAWATGDTRDRPTCATANLRRPASEGHVTF